MNYPLAIKTEDGYIFRKQEDGSYTNGDLTFNSLDEIEVDYTIIPTMYYKYEINQKLWLDNEPVRVKDRKYWCADAPIYFLERPDGSLIEDPTAQHNLTAERKPDQDTLEIGDRIGCYGTVSKIQATFPWTTGTTLYLVYNAQGQTQWATRRQIHKYKHEESALSRPLGSIWHKEWGQWVRNLGPVETHEGPGIKYWIGYNQNREEHYQQAHEEDLTREIHWETKYKLKDKVEYKNDVWKISSYVNTRRYNDGKSADESVIYKLLRTEGKRTITQTAFQGELGEYIPKFNNGDRVRVSDESIISSTIKGKYGFIMSQVSKSAYQIAFPAGQAEKGTAKFARTEVVAAKFLTLEEK
jgi:hypothetical protein